MVCASEHGAGDRRDVGIDVSTSIKWRCAVELQSDRALTSRKEQVPCETSVRLVLTFGVSAAYFKRIIMVGV